MQHNVTTMSACAHERPSSIKRPALPLVSVIIPTYNRLAFVRQAVESVLSQDYPHFELIVVDDGSDDGTDQMLARHGDAIKVIKQRNKGVSAARNTGIRYATGELIALLDADDLWLPGKLRKQVLFFQNHPQTMLCQTEEIWVRDGKRVNPKKRHQKQSGDIFEPSLALCLVSPSAVMIKKTLFQEVGLFDESLPACEDYDLWLRIGCKYPIYLIDTPLIVKRGGHGDQLSRMPELDKYRIRSLVKLLRTGRLSPGQHAAALAMLAQKCTIYAQGCRKRGRFKQADYYQSLPTQFTL